MIAVYKTLFWSITEKVSKAERFPHALDCTTLSSLKTNIQSIILNMKYIFLSHFGKFQMILKVWKYLAKWVKKWRDQIIQTLHYQLFNNSYLWKWLNLSHLSVHVVNRLLRKNRKPIPKFLSGKKTLKKCNPPDFKFYPSKFTDKNFPHMV